MRINGRQCGLVGFLLLTLTFVCFYINSSKSISEWIKTKQQIDNIRSQLKAKLVSSHISKKCGSYVSKAVTNASLLEFYTTCVDTAGKHQLTKVDTELFNAVFKEDNFKNVICEEKERRFITGQDLVALPSVPGSGNTWTRQLLEDLTGTYTPYTI